LWEFEYIHAVRMLAAYKRDILVGHETDCGDEDHLGNFRYSHVAHFYIPPF